MAGGVELQRRGAEAADLVRLAWDRMLRDPAPPARSAEGSFRWTTTQLAELARVAPIDKNKRRGGLVAFDVLLVDADGGHTPQEALRRVELALANHPQADRRAEGLLRALQFAAAGGQRGEVLRTLKRLKEELGFEDARNDTAYRLLAAFAAAAHLSDEELADEQRELVAAWLQGALALPAPADVWHRAGSPSRWRYRPNPRVEALAQRLEGLSPTYAGEARAAADREGRRIRALLAQLGELPAPPADGHWHSNILAPAQGPELLLTRRDENGALRGVFVTPPTLLAALARSVELAQGFHVGSSTGDDSSVGPPIELVAGALTVALSHDDPAALVRAEQGRILGLRLAFGTLALLSALATFFTGRALRRERRLAQLKTAFVAGVSHDLRTPLASILLMAENLEAGRVVGEAAQGRYHTAIRREAQRLRRLVEDVLDFSRIERGERPRLAREELELAPFVDDLAVEARERVEQAGGTLRFERGELCETALLDAEAVRRSVANLVENALRHSGTSDVTLVARVEDGRFLVLEVADRGCGVPASRREEIFRPFARLERGSASEGTGLGLAIVRAVARAHGGEATALEGQDGVGARFRLRLDLMPHDSSSGPVDGGREAG